MISIVAFHAGIPGSIPEWNFFKLVETKRPSLKVTQVAQVSSMSHLIMLQIQENGISELNIDAAQWGHIALSDHWTKKS